MPAEIRYIQDSTFRDRFEVVKNQWPSDVRELVDELNERGEKVIFLGDGVPPTEP